MQSGMYQPVSSKKHSMINSTPEAQPLPEPSSPLPSSFHHLPCSGRHPALVVPTMHTQLTPAVSLASVLTLRYCGHSIIHCCNTAQHSTAWHGTAQHGQPACTEPGFCQIGLMPASMQRRSKLGNDHKSVSRLLH